MLAGSLACATLPLLPAARAPAAARASLSAQALAPDVVWIRGAGANVVALRDGHGLAFIDGGLAANSRRVLELARRELGDGPAHTLINTHWHPDHTGLNDALGRSGARIIAHENTRLWLGTSVERVLDAPPHPPLPAHARPNATTYSQGEIAIGTEAVRYGHLLQAHTDGDLYVHLPRANVLVTGGVVHGRGWSIVDHVTGGWINGMVAGYRTMVQLCNDDTRIVTAHGDRLMTRRELDEERGMLQKLAETLGRMLRSGFGPEDVIAAAPAKEFEARYGDATEFLEASFRSLWPHMAPDA